MTPSRTATPTTSLSPLQATRQDRLDEIAGFRATLGTKAMTAFAADDSTKLFVDPASRTFAVSGTAVGRDGRTRGAAIAGHHDGRGVATITHAEGTDGGETPGATARRALAAAGRARAVALCTAAAGGGKMTIRASADEIAGASRQLPDLDAASAHGRLLARAQRDVATDCGTRKGRAALSFLACANEETPRAARQGATLTIDVAALAVRTDPSQLEELCATLSEVRRDDLRRQARHAPGHVAASDARTGGRARVSREAHAR